MQTGWNALHVASHYGQMEFVREILTRVPATLSSEAPIGADGPVTGAEVRQTFGETTINLIVLNKICGDLFKRQSIFFGYV